jgi:hypothetical protein
MQLLAMIRDDQAHQLPLEALKILLQHDLMPPIVAKVVNVV